MVYIQIWGGLGNQMFQFAAAKAVSISGKTKVGICLDKINQHPTNSDFTKRTFELDKVFVLKNFVFVNSSDYNYILHPGKSIFRKILNRLKRTSYFFEKGLSYDNSIKKLSAEAYIEGYFQSENYFDSCMEEILSDFRFRQKPSEKTNELLIKIATKTSVAVHIRRGDFIEKKGNLATHGVCSNEYYISAIEQFKNYDNLIVVIVSDDPGWVYKNMNFGCDTVYVNWNADEDSWQDMYIISKCNHAIIANSSFSWWGAMLNRNPEKKIIAPARWYADEGLQKQTADLIPTSWIKI